MTDSSQAASPAGQVVISGDTATLSFRRDLRHAPQAVWDALTDPAQLRAWFMVTHAEVEHRAGGSLEMVTGPAQFRWTGRVLTWDPPCVYEYEWNAEPRDELPRGERSIVRWQLEPTAEGTALTLTPG